MLNLHRHLSQICNKNGNRKDVVAELALQKICRVNSTTTYLGEW